MNEDSRTKNSIRNIRIGLLSQVILLALNFISRTLFIRNLGEYYLGINGLFSNIISLLSLVDLGLTTSMIYTFFEPLCFNDIEKIDALTSFYKKVFIFICSFVFLLGVLVLPIIQGVINFDNRDENIYLYYFLYLLNCVASYMFAYRIPLIIADQKKYVISRISFVFNLFRIFFQIIVIYRFKSFFLYLIIQIFATLFENIYTQKKAEKMYPSCMNKVELTRKDRGDILSNIKSMFIYRLSIVLINSTDNIFISKLVGTIVVGFYSNYVMLITAINYFITVLFTSISASIGNLIVKEDNKKREEIFNVILFCGLWMGALLSNILYSCLSDFIRLWIGRKYVLEEPAVLAIVFNFYLVCVLNPLWRFREASGLFAKTKYIMLVCALVNICLSLFLGARWGLPGILFSTAFARITTYFWYEAHILYKIYFKSSCKNYLIWQLLNFIIVISLMLINKLFMYYVNYITWQNLIIKFIFSIMLVNLSYYFLFRKTHEFRYAYRLFINNLSTIK